MFLDQAGCFHGYLYKKTTSYKEVEPIKRTSVRQSHKGNNLYKEN
jgi:hypothetical protein